MQNGYNFDATLMHGYCILMSDSKKEMKTNEVNEYEKEKKMAVYASCITYFCLIRSCGLSQRNNAEDQDSILAPYFVVESSDSSVVRFPLKGTDVTVNINGMIAETYVNQTYTNVGEVPINAKYVFPASSDVTVHDLFFQR